MTNSVMLHSGVAERRKKVILNLILSRLMQPAQCCREAALLTEYAEPRIISWGLCSLLEGIHRSCSSCSLKDSEEIMVVVHRIFMELCSFQRWDVNIPGAEVLKSCLCTNEVRCEMLLTSYFICGRQAVLKILCLYIEKFLCICFWILLVRM